MSHGLNLTLSRASRSGCYSAPCFFISTCIVIPYLSGGIKGDINLNDMHGLTRMGVNKLGTSSTMKPFMQYCIKQNR